MPRHLRHGGHPASAYCPRARPWRGACSPVSQPFGVRAAPCYATHLSNCNSRACARSHVKYVMVDDVLTAHATSCQAFENGLTHWASACVAPMGEKPFFPRWAPGSMGPGGLMGNRSPVPSPTPFSPSSSLSFSITLHHNKILKKQN